ncbi:MAG TPA: DUF1707 domain-containing protein [Trebonia sp.]|jgi:hypothetical protein|nr:DUF1707 domain-containing protein [Trebonia sp.]
MAIDDRIRVTHHEREAAAEELRAAYAVGCLDDDELDGRISRAYTAKTRGDLAALVYDLPAVAAPGDAGQALARQTAAADWPHRGRAALGLVCWLLLAAVGAWLIALTAGGVIAVPLIFGWLAVLRLCGRLARWGRQLAAALLITRLSSMTNAPVRGTEQVEG